GFVYGLTSYGLNHPEKIVGAIADACDTDIVSEHQPQYWGFDTYEEWDAAWDKMAKEGEAESEPEFYNQLLKHLRGEPNDIEPGTVAEAKAEIAKRLVERDPALLSPINKDKLLNEVNSFHEAARDKEAKFFNQLLKYLSGEPNDIELMAVA